MGDGVRPALVVASLASLTLADAITPPPLAQILPRLLGIVGVATVAVWLVLRIGQRAARNR